LTIGLVAVVPGPAVGQPPAELRSDELVGRCADGQPRPHGGEDRGGGGGGPGAAGGTPAQPHARAGGQKAISPDNNLNVGLSLPLDSTVEGGRVGVAERELDARRRQVADRERRLRADVRMRRARSGDAAELAE